MEPTPYHRRICDYLERREPALWRWVAAAEADDVAQLRLHLLKTTYQLSADAHPDLHAIVAQVCAALGIAPAVSLYQAHRAEGTNVAVYVAGPEAHIVFQGDVLELLSPAELTAVLGHELSHYMLWQRDGLRYWTGSRVLDRLAAEEHGSGVWSCTDMRYRQYTEIYADRGAYRVCNDIGPCIASLVKVQTGIKQVHVESFLKQAEQILAQDGSASEHASHPQAYLRAKALSLHAAGAPDAEQLVARLLEGPLRADQLDILEQQTVHDLTRSVVSRLLAPSWFASEAVLALARRYFDDFDAGELPHTSHLGANAGGAVALPAGHQLGDFLALVLLDFVCVDPTLDDLPAAAALRVAEELDIADAFDAVLLKESKWKKTALAKLKRERDALLAQALAAPQ